MSYSNPKHRYTSLATIVLATSLAATACAGGGGSDANGEAETGGHLNVLGGSEPNTIDPIFGRDVAGGRYQFNLFYEPLIRMEPDGEFTPMLAEDYELSEDGTEIVFTIREDVLFHDGTEFDAEAVVFNLERVIEEETSPYNYQLTEVETVEVTDENEVTLTLSEASGAILPYLAHEAGFMVSPTAVEDLGEDFGRNPVGTGPFEFVSWSSGRDLVAQRFDDYWRSDADGVQLPYVDEVVTAFQEDPNRARAEIETANVDIVERLTPRDVEALESDPEIELLDLQRRAQYYMFLNLDREPTDDINVRKALSLAVNREEMAQTVAGDSAEVTPTMIPTTDWSFNEDLEGYEYDPDEARRLLDEAGASDLSLTLNFIDREPDSQMAQMLQSYYEEIGVELTLLPLERVAHTEALDTRDYDMAFGRVTQPTVDPSTVFATQYGPSGHFGQMIRDDDFYQRIEDARLAVEQDERQEIYTEIQQHVLDEAYRVYFFGAPVPYAMRDYVDGLSSDADGQWRLDEVQLND